MRRTVLAAAPRLGRPACVLRVSLALALMAVSFGHSAAVAAATECPNEAIRQGQGTTYLPECMALEMVSPVKKQSQPAIYPSFSANGERVLFTSTAALGGTTSLVDPLGDFYIATRGTDGWSTAATTAPGSFGFGFANKDKAGAFTPDFGRWVSLESTQPQYLAGEQTLYEGTLEGAWATRSPLLEPLNDPSRINFEADVRASVTDASADLSHVFVQPLTTQTNYLPGDPQPPKASEFENGNTYVMRRGSQGEPVLELLGRDATGTVWGGNCGTWVGGGGTSKNPGGRTQGAVSADGSRVFFSTRPGQTWDQVAHTGPSCELSKPVRIMVREETPTGPQIEELLPPAPATGSDFFEGASEDQNRVYFTSSRSLSGTDQDLGAEECSSSLGASKGCDLYLYETTPTGHQLIQVSAGGHGDPTPGEGADVLKGVTAISGDGSHVYFVAQGVLTTDPNPENAVAELGKPNLYVYDAETRETAFVGTLSSADSGTLYGAGQSYYDNAVAVPMLVEGGNGHILVFESAAELTAGDSDGSHRDVYRYDAEATPPTLECISCRPGGSDSEPFDVTSRAITGQIPGPEFAELKRWVSEDGQAIVFGTKEQMQLGEEPSVEKPFLWLDGSLTRLPGAKRLGSHYEYLPTVSADGREVAFESSRQLVPQDQDSAEDVYVARAEGGFPPPESEPAQCLGEACQGAGVPPPPAQTAGSASYEGAGNPKRQSDQHKAKKHKKKAKKHKKHNSRKSGDRK